jgi:hypothetical protein
LSRWQRATQRGEERIANELLLKIGVRISPRTVRRYTPKPSQRPTDPKHRWVTFARNHTKSIIACDFFVVATAAFQLVYVFVINEPICRLATVSLTRTSDF